MRNWLYEWAFGGDAVALLKGNPSLPLISPVMDALLGASSFSRDPGDFGGSGFEANWERGDRGEDWKSPMILVVVGDFGLLGLL